MPKIGRPVSLGDEYFVMKAYADQLAEIAKSQLAATRATQPEIKAFAERMIRDHTECNNKLVELARKKGIGLPTMIDAVHGTAIARLGRMSGSDFDKTYMMAKTCAHVDAIRLFERQSCKGEDAEIKEFATKGLPPFKITPRTPSSSLARRLNTPSSARSRNSPSRQWRRNNRHF